MTEVLSVLFYALALFFILKFSKNNLLEISFLIVLTIACKFIIGANGSFYPIFALPVLLSLRHEKKYSLFYIFAVLIITNYLYGFGSWTIFQLALYGLISFITFKFRNSLNKWNIIYLVGYNFAAMFIFGVLMDVGTFYFGNFLNYNNVFTAVQMGLPFDLKYGISGALYGSITLGVAYLASMEKVFLFRNLSLVKKVEIRGV